MNHKIIIAIDGPSASGKSTVARKVAEVLGYVHVDSGALYRGITWSILSAGINPAKKVSLISHIDSCVFLFTNKDRSMRFTINGVDPWESLRSDTVRENVSTIAAVPEIRERVVKWLRQMTSFGNLAMEGRDIASVVFPDTPFKFYIDADPAERARRRCKELAASEETDEESVRNSLESRDRKDSARDAAPLKVAAGATVIDSTHMTIDQVVAFIVARVSPERH